MKTFILDCTLLINAVALLILCLYMSIERGIDSVLILIIPSLGTIYLVLFKRFLNHD